MDRSIAQLWVSSLGCSRSILGLNHISPLPGFWEQTTQRFPGRAEPMPDYRGQELSNCNRAGCSWLVHTVCVCVTVVSDGCRGVVYNAKQEDLWMDVASQGRVSMGQCQFSDYVILVKLWQSLNRSLNSCCETQKMFLFSNANSVLSKSTLNLRQISIWFVFWRTEHFIFDWNVYFRRPGLGLLQTRLENVKKCSIHLMGYSQTVRV